MQIKRLIATLLASAIILSNTVTTLAEDNIDEDNVVSITEENIESLITSVPDINEQIDDLYDKIGNELGINKIYVKQLHIIAGGQAMYADKKPDILKELTIDSFDEPMKIAGANTHYKIAEFIDCDDDKIERPSKYYLPDAIYSVSYDIASLMGQRYNCNREGYQIYYDSLQDDVKKNIAFYEALLLYTGTSKRVVNNFFAAYEKILYDKSSNENVVEQTKDGKYTIKDEFLHTLNDIGIVSDIEIEHLAIAMSFDEMLAVNDSLESLQEQFNLPYKENYTSRENMMVAAASLCGKVRYVWGGGHSGASMIDGINPMWKRFNDMYPTTETSTIQDENGNDIVISNPGYRRCISPKGSWCPIHGEIKSAYHGGNVYSLEEYVDISAKNMKADDLLDNKYREMLSQVDYSRGINMHTLDGLDCSGFASWLYNQITDKYTVNSVAREFTKQSALTSIEYGTEIYPGDIFAWTEHIVIIVGKVNENAKAFVTIEQTSNCVKYGVIHYKDASDGDIQLARQIAADANKLIGGLEYDTEKPHVYCMDSVGIYDTDEEVTVTTNELINTKDNSDNNEGRHWGTIYETKAVWFPDGWASRSDCAPWKEVPNEFEYYDREIFDDGELITYHIKIGEGYIDDDVATTNKEVVTDKKQTSYREIGRFKDTYIDEDTIINGFEKPIKDMYAQDIIQHTLTKLPISYVTGYNIYDGDIFNKNDVATDLGISIK